MADAEVEERKKANENGDNNNNNKTVHALDMSNRNSVQHIRIDSLHTHTDWGSLTHHCVATRMNDVGGLETFCHQHQTWNAV
jgi:hypothetical protein